MQCDHVEWPAGGRVVGKVEQLEQFVKEEED